MYENSVTYQFVGNVVSGLATGNPASALPEGAVGVFTEAGVSVDPTGLVGPDVPVKIGTRANGVLKFSPVFTRGEANMVGLAFVAPVEQVSFIGWNGTAGALDTEIDATYVASVRLENTQGVYNNTPIIKTVPVYLPDNVAFPATALGQFEHATRLVNSIHAQFSADRLGGQLIRAERVTSDAGVPVDNGTTGDATHFLTTQGSTLVTFEVAAGTAGDIDIAANGDTNLIVGSFVNIGGSVYEIVAATDDNITLDIPYAGPSGRVAFAAVSSSIDALDDAEDWGVRLTGVTPAQFNAKTDMFPRRVRFQASYTKTFTDPFNLFRKVTEPADAAFTTTIAANEGLGSGAEIAKREVYTNMNEQNHIVSHFPPTNYRDSAVVTNNYRQVIIRGLHDRFLDVATGKRPVSTFNIIVALEDTGVAWDTLDDIFGI